MAGFRAGPVAAAEREAGPVAAVDCPRCGHRFIPSEPVRFTEASNFRADQARDRVGKWTSHGAGGLKPGGGGHTHSDVKGRKITLTAADKKAVKAAKLTPAQQMTYTQQRFAGQSHADALASVKKTTAPSARTARPSTTSKPKAPPATTTAPAKAKAPAKTASPARPGSSLGDTQGRTVTLTAEDKKAVKAARLSPAQQMTYTQYRFAGQSHADALARVSGKTSARPAPGRTVRRPATATKAKAPKATKTGAAGKKTGAGSVLTDIKGRQITLTADDKKAVKAAGLSPAQQMTYTQNRFAGMSHADALQHAGEATEPGDQVAFAEAWINGQMSFSDIQELVRTAIRARLSTSGSSGEYRYIWLVDMSATDVVYAVDGLGGDELFQCGYTVTMGVDGAAVALGEPTEVIRTYMPVMGDTDVDDGQGDGPLAEGGQLVTEARETIPGRVLEAKGEDAAGNRVYRIRVIAYGDSKNLRRYPEAVMRAAAPLYDGAKIYDHHRTDEELRTSTISGLVGYLRNPEAVADGIEADAVLLPSATQPAEALDASLAAQESGLPPIVGFSHDVMATYKPLLAGAVRMQEATSIVKVNSADIVADPAAGGQATRMVAGGLDTTDDPAATVAGGESTKESTVGTTTADVLAALKDATPEMLSAVGLSKVGTSTQTEAVDAGTQQATEAVDEMSKTSFVGRMAIRTKVGEAFPAEMVDQVVESVSGTLPEKFTESAVDDQISTIKAAAALFERGGLTPKHTVQVTKEALAKKTDALDAFFAGDARKGYASFKEAFIDFTGIRPGAFGEDFNRRVLRESFGSQGGYDSGLREGLRETESMDSATWNLALGDSITRRMIAEYAQPSLQTWRELVSVVTVNDFRTQRIERLGGYGTLPVVAQGAPYQPLTSPTGEEITYAVTKKGGTEDVTYEMIANDDVRAIAKIPVKLGLAAAQTLFRFVWDFFPTNAATSYDSVLLFHATHGNTDANALSQSALSTGRRKMRKQSAYGDSSNVLSIVPKTLIVPPELEELAFQLCTSAVAIPGTPAGPSDTPNIHQGLKPIVVDYFASATGWYLGADPNMVPTIEIGFFQGRQDPELFTQADQTVGSVFNSDKITYKIRHTYSGAVADHRGLYRGNS